MLSMTIKSARKERKKRIPYIIQSSQKRVIVVVNRLSGPYRRTTHCYKFELQINNVQVSVTPLCSTVLSATISSGWSGRNWTAEKPWVPFFTPACWKGW